MDDVKKKSNSDEVLNHWLGFADEFTLAPQEFYAAVEKELETLKIPGLEVSREEYAEGGLLSAKRVYFRMIRERLAFDVCAAPFGTRYFFSCRTIYSPVVIKLWHVVLVILLFYGVYYGMVPYLGVLYSVIAVLTLILAIGATCRNIVSMGISNLDTVLLKIPAVGPIYERFFRKETYYRLDTRLTYLDTIPNIIKELAEHFTGDKGIKLVRQYQIAPLLGELYKLLPPREKEEKPVSLHERAEKG